MAQDDGGVEEVAIVFLDEAEDEGGAGPGEAGEDRFELWGGEVQGVAAGQGLLGQVALEVAFREDQEISSLVGRVGDDGERVFEGGVDVLAEFRGLGGGDAQGLSTPVIPAAAQRRAGTQGRCAGPLGPCVLRWALGLGLMGGGRSSLGPRF